VRRRFIAFAALLALGLLLGRARPLAAEPTLPLPPQLPARDRERVEDIVKRSFASTRMEPGLPRPRDLQYLLDRGVRQPRHLHAQAAR
jgi:hypothetical protein